MMLKNIMKSLIFSLGTSLLFSLNVFAAENNIINDNGVLHYVDDYGNIKKGKFYDEVGNLYFADENGALNTFQDSNKQNYINGKLIIPGLEKNVEINAENCLKYENNEKIVFESKEDMYAFLEYYYTQYSMREQNLFFTYDTDNFGPGSDNEKQEWTLYNKKSYDRQAVCDLIDNTFGEVKGETTHDKIIDVLLKLKSIKYDLSYMKKDISTCINNKTGCCWHYAKIASYLLNKNGVYTEIIPGKNLVSGEGHCWIRCWEDDKWRYVDPTFYVTESNPFYVDIDYLVYQEMYAQTGTILNGTYLQN